jgi:hypothetical protein
VLNASLSALTIKERPNIEHFGEVVNRLKVIEGFSASPMATMLVSPAAALTKAQRVY